MIQEKIVDKKFILMPIVLIVMIIIGCAANTTAQTEQELQLKRRVDLFYKYFSDGNAEKMWQMTSKNFKKLNDDDKKDYIKNLRKFRLVELKTCIKSIKIENTRAIVTVETSMWIKEKQEWLSSTENNVWVYEDKNWFFESQIEK